MKAQPFQSHNQGVCSAGQIHNQHSCSADTFPMVLDKGRQCLHGGWVDEFPILKVLSQKAVLLNHEALIVLPQPWMPTLSPLGSS